MRPQDLQGPSKPPAKEAEGDGPRLVDKGLPKSRNLGGGGDPTKTGIDAYESGVLEVLP